MTSIKRAKLIGYILVAGIIIIPFLALIVTGCASHPKPQQGGNGSMQLPGGGVSMLRAPENPQSTSAQEQETLIEREYVPEPDATEPVPNGRNPSPDLAGLAPSSIAPPRASEARPPGRLISERIHARATTQLGTAQKDTTRELGTRLANMRLVMLVGIGLLVAGPVVGWKIGWFTNGCIAGAVGLLLIILSAVLPGNEAWLGLGGLLLIPLVAYAYYKAHHDASSDRWRLSNQPSAFWQGGYVERGPGEVPKPFNGK